jgi:transcription-repair coupling factor (superfamily II helicase)
VTTLRALAQKVLSPERLVSHEMALAVGQDYERDDLVARLVGLGYERVPIVSALGQFSVRGGLMDLFSLGSEDPWRLEFDDNTLVSLRRFDPLTQRSIEQLAKATVLPRYEIALSPGEAAEVLARLSAAGDRAAEAARREGRDLERMTSELFFEGMERVAGHYGQDLTTLWDYVPADAFVVADDPERLLARADRLDEEVVRFHAEAIAHFPLVSPPEELFVAGEEALARRGARPLFHVLGPVARKKGRAADPPVLFELATAPQPAFTRNLDLVRGFLADLNAGVTRSTSCATTPDSASAWASCSARRRPGSTWVSSRADFTIGEARFALLTDHEIFERYRRRIRRRKRTGGLSLAELDALEPGRLRRARGPRDRHLQRARAPDHERAGDRLPRARLRRGRQAVRAGEPARPRVQVDRRGGRAADRPPPGFVGVGAHEGEGEEGDRGDDRRAAAHIRAAQGAPGARVRARHRVAARARGVVHLRGDAAPGARDRRGEGGHGEPAADGPPRVRRRRLRQDRGRDPRGVQGRAWTASQVAVLVPTTILAQQHYDTFRERLADFP